MNGSLINPSPLANGIGDSVWLCVGTSDADCDQLSEFQRHKVVNGVVVDEAGRAITLTFTPGTWSTPQRVYLWAVDDPRAEGDRNVMIQHSVISADARFAGAAVRQVSALVYDNDTPGVYAVPVTPGGTEVDGQTLVIEGSALTERTDDVLLSLAMKPAVGATIYAPAHPRLLQDRRHALGRAQRRRGGHLVLGVVRLHQLGHGAAPRRARPQQQ